MIHLENIVSVFRETVNKFSGKCFLFDTETRITYRDADLLSDAIAGDLSNIGIVKDSVVGICGPDQVQIWLLIIAIWKLGALPAMVDPRTPPESIEYFIDDLNAEAMVADFRSFEMLSSKGAKNLILLSDVGMSGNVGKIPSGQHDAASSLFVSYTSGTTGSPKGVVLLSGPVTTGTRFIAERLKLRSTDVLLATTPISSSFQLVAALMPVLHVGATLGLVAGQNIAKICEIVKIEQVSVFIGYPLTLADFVNSVEGGASNSLRLALSGGSPLAPRIKRDYQSKLGISLLESYGQSELGGFMVLGSTDDGDQSFDGYAGRSSSDRNAFVGDEKLNPAIHGEIGEVLVDQGYFARYLNKEEAFKATTAGGFLHTGDLAKSDADGYIKVVGRVQEGVAAKSRGGFLRELEDVAYENKSILHAVVVETKKGSVVLFVQPKINNEFEISQFQDLIQTSVVPGLLPSIIKVLSSMPRTFSGKADRRLLTEEAEKLTSLK